MAVGGYGNPDVVGGIMSVGNITRSLGAIASNQQLSLTNTFGLVKVLSANTQRRSFTVYNGAGDAFRMIVYYINSAVSAGEPANTDISPVAIVPIGAVYYDDAWKGDVYILPSAVYGYDGAAINDVIVTEYT